MKKKAIPLIMAGILMVSGCSSIIPEQSKYSIVCTTFPQYDWVRNIVDTDVDVEYLIDTGVDFHNYQPTAQDILKIQNCDMFIYIGGESDEWVDSMQFSPKTDVINLFEVNKDYLLLEDGEEDEYDEHIWFSFDVAENTCQYLSTKLPLKTTKNMGVYLRKLDNLKDMYSTVINTADVKTVLIAGRNPFAYLANDWDLTIKAAFKGCSAETEASFEKIQELKEFASEHHITAALTVDSTNTELVNTIFGETALPVYNLNSMQTASPEDTYVDIMKANIIALDGALH